MINITVINAIYDNHEQLLPHFIPHYISLGVNSFIFGIKGGRKNPAWTYVEGKAHENSKSGVKITVEEFLPYPDEICSFVDSRFINQAKAKIGGDGWYIPADIDEFHVINNLNFQEVAEICQSQDKKYVLSFFADRLTASKTILKEIKPDINIFEQFPIEIPMTRQIGGGADQKVCLAHTSIDIGTGHHYVENDTNNANALDIYGTTYHFKWFGNLLDREKEKLRTNALHGKPWAQENQNIIDYFSENI
jgi:hypothetical protein